MLEKWLPIPFAPEYQASNFGRILGKRGVIMNPSTNYSGYLVCDLNYHQYRVNRIICQTFHGAPPSEEHHAAHKDSDRQNNYANNLYWGTPSDNGNDLASTDRQKGSASPAAILKDNDVQYIRMLVSDGYSISSIHKHCFPNVCRATISHAALGRTWSHVR